MFVSSVAISPVNRGWPRLAKNIFQGEFAPQCFRNLSVNYILGPVGAANTSFPLLLIGNDAGMIPLPALSTATLSCTLVFSLRSRHATCSVSTVHKHTATILMTLISYRAEKMSKRFPGSVMLSQEFAGVSTQLEIVRRRPLTDDH